MKFVEDPRAPGPPRAPIIVIGVIGLPRCGTTHLVTLVAADRRVH